MLTPELVAKSGSEHANQVAVFLWASVHVKEFPELEWMYAVPNAGKRSFVVGARMKAEGLRSGVPDICLPVARGEWSSLYIEMKAGDNTLSDSQVKWKHGLTKLGNCVVTCWGWEDAVSCIKNYLRRKNAKS